MNRWLNTIVSIAIPAILLCAIAHAQDFPKREAFVGFSYVNGDTNGGPRENLYGGEVSFSQNALKWLGAEVAGSGYYGHVVVTDVRDYGFGGGPRLNYKNFFLHSLVGADWYEACFIQRFCITNTSFAAAFGGGIEAPLRRSMRCVFLRIMLSLATSDTCKIMFASRSGLSTGLATRSRLRQRQGEKLCPALRCPSPHSEYR